MLPIRLRDFVADPDGWIYAVSAYDNERNVGCVLRYVPETGERIGLASGTVNTISRRPMRGLHAKNRPMQDLSSAFPSEMCAGS